MVPESRPRDYAVQHALKVVGDRWSLLVVRQPMPGVARFNVIQRETGVPRDRLADRLRKLEEAGVIARDAYCDPPLEARQLTASWQRVSRPCAPRIREIKH